jgi:septum formation protein
MTISKSTDIILASASPRRKELLQQAGFTFTVVASGVPEVRSPGEAPIAFATRLAREKAQDVASRSPAAAIVIGADTVVVCNEEVLGKPVDAEDAKRMLRLLAGRTHQVITGVCVLSGDVVELAAEVTMVQMLTVSAQEIDDYVASGEPTDKAGAYAIQGRAARWIPRIQGCYFNVVGLPLALVTAMIEATCLPDSTTS